MASAPPARSRAGRRGCWQSWSVQRSPSGRTGLAAPFPPIRFNETSSQRRRHVRAPGNPRRGILRDVHPRADRRSAIPADATATRALRVADVLHYSIGCAGRILPHRGWRRRAITGAAVRPCCGHTRGDRLPYDRSTLPVRGHAGRRRRRIRARRDNQGQISMPVRHFFSRLLRSTAPARPLAVARIVFAAVALGKAADLGPVLLTAGRPGVQGGGRAAHMQSADRGLTSQCSGGPWAGSARCAVGKRRPSAQPFVSAGRSPIQGWYSAIPAAMLPGYSGIPEANRLPTIQRLRFRSGHRRGTRCPCHSTKPCSVVEQLPCLAQCMVPPWGPRSAPAPTCGAGTTLWGSITTSVAVVWPRGPAAPPL
jgi:hypothetical protein